MFDWVLISSLLVKSNIQKDEFFPSVVLLFYGGNSNMAFKISPGMKNIRSNEVHLVKIFPWLKKIYSIKRLKKYKAKHIASQVIR